jgi:NAD(P)-dependent dehydrogenase (short-subunit alcohol dehydrogenase family)
MSNVQTKPAIIVTGGALNIGASICQHLIDAGFYVVVLDIVEPQFNDCAPAWLSCEPSQNHQKDTEYEYYKVDLSDEVATASCLQSLCTNRVFYGLVNCVGVVKPKSLEDTPLSDLTLLMNLNFRPAVQCAQAVLPGMKAQGFGRIINITSRVVLGKTLRTGYCATKGALAAATRTWALELASSGITVNAVAPGPIATSAFWQNNPPESDRAKAIVNAIPVQRMGEPEDVSNAVDFFMQKESGFITGQTLFVCGGMTVGLAT